MARILQDVTAMAARIAELEAQIASGTKETKVTLQDYKGSPVLYFEGSFKPFHAGLSKCKAVMEMSKEVSTFIKTGGKKIA